MSETFSQTTTFFSGASDSRRNQKALFEGPPPPAIPNNTSMAGNPSPALSLASFAAMAAGGGAGGAMRPQNLGGLGLSGGGLLMDNNNAAASNSSASSTASSGEQVKNLAKKSWTKINWFFFVLAIYRCGRGRHPGCHQEPPRAFQLQLRPESSTAGRAEARRRGHPSQALLRLLVLLLHRRGRRGQAVLVLFSAGRGRRVGRRGRAARHQVRAIPRQVDGGASGPEVRLGGE